MHSNNSKEEHIKLMEKKAKGALKLMWSIGENKFRRLQNQNDFLTAW